MEQRGETMRRVFALVCVLCLAALLIFSVAAEAYDGYIVKLAEPPMDLFSVSGGASDILVVEDQETAEQMVRDGVALYAEPNYVMELLGTAPNDPEYSEQWSLAAINYPALYASGYDGSGVTVAIIDTGIDLSHPDLADVSLSPYSKNCLGNGLHADAFDRDQIGHGSFVTSQIAAVTDNGAGIASVAPSAEIMVLRCVSKNTSDKYAYSAAYDSGSGTVSTVSGAIRYAVDHGADIINISLGMTGSSTTLAEAVTYAVEKGAIVVSAVGNAGNSTPYYPAGFPDVIGVGSVSRSGDGYARSWFSQYNDTVDIVAPGGTVLGIHVYPSGGKWYTDVDATYRTDSGTSYACPLVAGIVAIAKQIDPTLDGDGVLALLAHTVQNLGDEGKDTAYGYGLVDVSALLTAMETVLTVIPVTQGALYDRVAAYAEGKTFALYDVSLNGYVPKNGAPVQVTHTAKEAYVYRVVGEYLLPVEHSVQDGRCSFISLGGEYAVSDTPLVLYGDATGDGRLSVIDVLRILKGSVDDTVAINRAAADFTMDARLTVQDAMRLLKFLLSDGE